MKELSIEEKVKRYDEAIERAKEMIKAMTNIGGVAKVDDIQYLFPELKESEDEQHRKWILEYLYDGLRKSDEQFKDQFKAAITWLEKQYKKDEEIILLKDKIESLESARIAMQECHRLELEKLEKQGEKNPAEEYNITGIGSKKAQGKLGKMIKNLKPADKVEPKFHGGEWVVTDKNNIVQIKAIENSKYVLENTMRFSVDYVDKCWKKWIIQDAKDSDVLCDYYEAFDNPLIFILKKFEHVNFGLVRPSDYSSYCFLTADNKQKFKEGTYHHECNIKPATKEQRDLLFAKMKEAGYEWNAEKKELKKIEQKPVPKFEVGDCIRHKGSDESYKIVTIDDNYYFCENNHAWAIRSQNHFELVEQKPAWSEEDENFMYDTLSNLTELKYRYGEGYGNVGKCIDWLSSIKERVQPKQEWSEENEKMLTTIVDYIISDNVLGSKYIDFLKSLRPQNTWKPSDEQMEALYEETQKSDRIRDDRIVSLYNDLKKLREE